MRRNRSIQANRQPSRFLLGVGIIGILALFVIGLATGAAYQLMTVDNMTATVTDKERMCESTSEGQDCKWIVLTNEMSFKNEDALWHLKFNSTDVQAKIERGAVYDIKYYGWRIPIFSVYPNIVSLDPVQR